LTHFSFRNETKTKQNKTNKTKLNSLSFAQSRAVLLFVETLRHHHPQSGGDGKHESKHDEGQRRTSNKQTRLRHRPCKQQACKGRRNCKREMKSGRKRKERNEANSIERQRWLSLLFEKPKQSKVNEMKSNDKKMSTQQTKAVDGASPFRGNAVVGAERQGHKTRTRRNLNKTTQSKRKSRKKANAKDRVDDDDGGPQQLVGCFFGCLVCRC